MLTQFAVFLYTSFSSYRFVVSVSIYSDLCKSYSLFGIWLAFYKQGSPRNLIWTLSTNVEFEEAGTSSIHISTQIFNYLYAING